MGKTKNAGIGQGKGGGRPLKFKSAKDLQTAIDGYFDSCYDYVRDMWGNRFHDKEHPDYRKPNKRKKDLGNVVFVMKKVRAFTVTDLALALDTSRETLLDYENGKYDDRDEDGNLVELTDDERKVNEQIEKFSDTIRRAKLHCYADTEQYLYQKGTAIGAKFSLSNNYGWEDKSTVKTEPIERRNPYENLDELTLRKLAEGDDASDD